MSKSQLRKEYEKRFGVQEVCLCIYDEEGNVTYREYPYGFWMQYEYDEEGNVTYRKDSDDFWVKREYDEEGNEIYRESSIKGITLDKRNNLEGKIATIDGKEYQLTKVK
jgi:YD repeat-containing protein